MTLTPSKSTAALASLAVLAALLVELCPSSSALRMVSGLNLLLVLPCVAATRLPPMQRIDVTGGRLAGSVALVLALIVLLGLLLAATSAGLTTRGMVVGALVLNVGLALLGHRSALQHALVVDWKVFSLSLCAVAAAVAIATTAYVLARQRAITQAHSERSYAAFILHRDDAGALDIGLSNPTAQAAQFNVLSPHRTGRSIMGVTVPAYGTRVLRQVIASPRPLTERERNKPMSARSRIIRITITTNGRRLPQPLILSTNG